MYNASKAALYIGSETWRRELEPLGVRTITLVTCAVKTNFFHTYQQVNLPENSRYTEVADLIRKSSDGRMQANAITAEQYAANVVRQIDKKSTVGPVWAGTSALMVRIALWLSPRPILVSHILPWIMR